MSGKVFALNPTNFSKVFASAPSKPQVSSVLKYIKDLRSSE